MNFLFLAASVLLSWTPVDDASYYNLYMGTKSMRDGTAATRVYKTTTPSYTVPSLTVGSTYYFYVRTICPYGSVLGDSNEIVYKAK